MGKKRKFELFGVDFVLCLVLYIFSIFLGSSDTLRTPKNMGWGLVTVFFVFSAAVLFLMRVIFKIYNNIWRYADVGVYLRLILSDLCAFAVIFGTRFLFPYLNMGFGVTGMFIALNCLAALTMRFFYKLFYAKINRAELPDSERSHRIKIAIIGAGNTGAALANELINNPKAHYKPICFVETSRVKIGQHLNGLPVYAEDDAIIDRIIAMPVQEIVIAIPGMDGEKRERMYNLYSQTGCKIKIYDYPLGSKENKEQKRRYLRELCIEDLLSRESIVLDNSLSKAYYAGKTVLITGGGGSIGSELCRQIAKMSPKRLVIFDIYENNAYEIQQELIRKYGDKLNLDVLIGSVRDVKRLDEVFSMVHPDVVLHAAAHKHVPLMEKSAVEAIKNNVFGTYNTANMAEKYGTEKFVLISTDKAVNPTNIMGASKRICETVIQCRRDSETKFVAVRFGNVLGSNGSVIPLFKKQIEEGGPITLTDKRIIRYFMTIPEASQLVLEAGAMAHRGELYVLNMGKPVKIYDLAVNMIKLSGLKPEEDIKIVEVGLRPGEKLYEELLIADESRGKTDNDLIFVEKDKPFTRDEIELNLQKLKGAIKASSSSETVKAAVRDIVPTYHDPEEVNSRSVIKEMLAE